MAKNGKGRVESGSTLGRETRSARGGEGTNDSQTVTRAGHPILDKVLSDLVKGRHGVLSEEDSQGSAVAAYETEASLDTGRAEWLHGTKSFRLGSDHGTPSLGWFCLPQVLLVGKIVRCKLAMLRLI